MQAVADDRDTAVAEVWQLRDAYTPAEDALGELLPSAHRLNDVHAGMLTDGGARLQLATGPVVVPPHMRKVLSRQRTASILCKGPDDYPLLPLFDRYVTRAGDAMPTEEPPPSRQAAFGAELFAFEDPLAGRIEQLTLHAENHREAAADLLRAADRAEARARRLSAYRYTIDAIAGDPQAHTWSAGSSRTGAGDGEQLVTVVRETLRRGRRMTGAPVAGDRGDPAHPLVRSRVQTVLLRAPGTRSCPSWTAGAGGATRPPTVRPGVLRRPGRPIVRWVSGNPDRAGRAEQSGEEQRPAPASGWEGATAGANRRRRR
jgi:hypothetical protein